MTADAIFQFIGLSLVVIITPGPDTALTIRNCIRGGNEAGLVTVVAIVIGQLCWASIASLGLQALVNTSQLAYTLLKYCGAVYLFIWAQSRCIRASESMPQQACILMKL